jgi:hypothetical protein
MRTLVVAGEWRFVLEYTASDMVNLLEASPGCVLLRQQYDGKTEDFSLLRLLEICTNCKSECQLVQDRIYGLIGILKSSQQGLIIPDYSNALPQVYVDILVSLLVPDTAPECHFVSLWGYIGKDLITSTGALQHLLEPRSGTKKPGHCFRFELHAVLHSLIL